MKKYFLFIFLIVIAIHNSIAQNNLVGNKYSGSHTSTSYFYEFISDSLVIHSGYGHAGFGSDTAKYHFQGDTVVIESTMLDKTFLIKGEYLVDINNRYDYKKIKEEQYALIKKGYAFHNSRKFSIKYPQVTASDSQVVIELENILKITFGLDTIQQLLLNKKELIPDRKIRVLDYYHLEPFEIETKNFKFSLSIFDNLCSAPYPTDSAFIYIRDINYNPNQIYLCFIIFVNLKEYLKMSIFFEKTDETWHLKSKNILSYLPY